MPLEKLDKARLGLILDCHGPEKVIDMLAILLFHAAAKALERGDYEGSTRFDRISRDLEDMEVRLDNEDSGQEWPSDAERFEDSAKYRADMIAAGRGRLVR
jgi:hypothetical protein